MSKKIETYKHLLQDQDAVAMYLEGILDEAELIECSDVPVKFISSSLSVFYGVIALKFQSERKKPVYSVVYTVLMIEKPTGQEEFEVLKYALDEIIDKYTFPESMTKDKAIKQADKMVKEVVERIKYLKA